ncbi:proteasome-type protease [Croceicoccus bisphenolivorans]|uniref:proteasome-type protease n=1 Tax=Croceicoccus bisphenolivorans TaxID=1783232 RepID=UPI00082EE00A|nr:proteasome-type protease [Croceicoccus bisphenolivorans]
MTYCVGMMLDKGLVLMSDTRTNSGVDNISVFRKMFHWSVPGERIISIMTAGNLATTQSVVSLLEERTKAPEDREPSILKAPTMFQVATIIGNLLSETIRKRQESNDHMSGGPKFTASMIVAGQIAGMEPRLFLIYPEGNFIEASMDTPFFQIGETKYGRPIIIRAYNRQMEFEEAAKLLMVSMDSTLAANLSVGMPLDLMVIERDRFEPLHERRIHASDSFFQAISTGWSEALRNAFHSLPLYNLDEDTQSE